MFTDPAQENIFQEEEFTDVRYRKELLPLWFRILTGLGVASGLLMMSIGILSIFSPEESNNKGQQSVFLIIICIFTAVSVSYIYLLLEKKWAIYGSVVGVAFQTLLLTAGVYFIYEDNGNKLVLLLLPIVLIVILQLIFLIKILFIFKRWLAYHPSVKPKR